MTKIAAAYFDDRSSEGAPTEKMDDASQVNPGLFL
jgi:hypothetical protein